MQTGRINTIDAAGREQVTLFDIGTGWYKFQLQRAAWHVQGSGRTELNAGDVLVAITRERGSHAVYLLEKQGIDVSEMRSDLA